MKLIIDIPDTQYNNIMEVKSMSLGRIPYKGIIMNAIRGIQNGTPISENATVCDIEDIKAEIYKERTNISFNLSEEKAKWVNSGIYDGLVWAEEIIDKHISGKGRE